MKKFNKLEEFLMKISIHLMHGQYLSKMLKYVFNMNFDSIFLFKFKDKKIAESREFYESLITQFPTCGKFWKIYVESEV